MRTLLVTTAAFAALMIGAPIGHAHADDFDVEKFGSSVEADGRPNGLDGGRPALPFEAALKGRGQARSTPTDEDRNQRRYVGCAVRQRLTRSTG
jgi:hypothetical protein